MVKANFIMTHDFYFADAIMRVRVWTFVCSERGLDVGDRNVLDAPESRYACDAKCIRCARGDDDGNGRRN